MTAANRADSETVIRNSLKRVSFIAQVLVVAGLCLPAAAAAANPAVIGEIGLGAGQMQFQKGLAVSASEGGDVYVADGESRILEFQPGGEFIRAFGFGVVPGAVVGTGSITAGSKAISNASASSGSFVVGQTITGNGIEAETTITAITSFGLEISKPATKTASGVALSAPEAPGNIPTNERKSLSLSGPPTSGTFTLTFRTPLPSTEGQTIGGTIIGATTSGSPTVTSVTATSGTATVQAGSTVVENVVTTAGAFELGQPVTGPGIRPNTVIVRVGGAGEHNFTLSAPASASGTEVSIDANPFLAPGQTVTGPGISPGTTITSIAPNGNITLSANATATASGVTLHAGIPYDATAAELESLLAALPVIGSGNVTVSGPAGGPWTIEFLGRYADTKVAEPTETFPQMYANTSGLNPASTASLGTIQPGGSALETCTTSCWRGERGSAPGQFNSPDDLAVDNDPASPSYGELYVIDPLNYRVEKFDPSSPTVAFDLMFGGGVDQGPHHPGDTCTAGFISEGDACGPGIAGTGPAHFYKSGSLEWGRELAHALAVGPGGVVYVGDYGRIQEFTPEGEFEGEIKFPEAEPTFVSALAVDSSGNIFERSATYGPGAEPREVVSQVPGVREYEPGQTSPVRTFDTEEASSVPTRIAVDGAGDLFVTEHNAAGASFRAFRPTGALYAEFGGGALESRLAAPQGFAVDSGIARAFAVNRRGSGLGAVQDVLAFDLPVAGAPLVGEQSASDIEPLTATLHASVNPQEFDTKASFEYTTTDFSNCGEPANSHCLKTSAKDLGSIWRADQIQAALSGLEANTTYHFRAVAESSRNGGETVVGPTESFTTLTAASVRNLTTQTVGSELVTLKFELNPNNSATQYVLHYGADQNYTGGKAEGTLPIGNSFVKKEVTFTNLDPDTTYHYQLVMTNENGPGGHGEYATADAVFTTELSAAEERSAEDCPENGSVHGSPSSTIREENHSLALPDCRAYEQVSAVNKEGGQAVPQLLLAPGGERVEYGSGGAFAGAQANEVATEYLAQRSGSGWSTRAVLGRPAGLGYEPVPDSFEIGYYSGELDSWLFPEIKGLDTEQARAFGTSGRFALGRSDGSYIWPASPLFSPEEGPPRAHFYFMGIRGQSEDLSRVFITTDSRLLPLGEDPRPDSYTGGAGSDRIYELTGVGAADPSLKLVAEVPLGLDRHNGQQQTGCEIDPEQTIGRPSRFTSADGLSLFYTAPIELEAGEFCGEEKPNPIALFDRVGEAAPIQLNPARAPWCSAPAPCATSGAKSPTFYGASPDGSRAWFTTSQPLTSSDEDATSDLYLSEVSNGQLVSVTQASAGDASDPNPGSGAGVRAVVRVSADGSHVAFVATGVLTEQPNGEGDSAAQGADNLYVYDATDGRVRFVASLCSGPSHSGSQTDSACPEGITGGEAPGANNDAEFWDNIRSNSTAPAALTPDGRYLLFSSLGQLAEGDTDSTGDIYRYDFETGQLIRVSFGHRGNDGNGNDDRFPAFIGHRYGSAPFELAEDFDRSMSADGSTVVFSTAAPLVSRDTNAGATPACESRFTGCDAYEWEEDGHGTCTEPGGCVGLVSDGVSPQGTDGVTISSSGRDIAFQTSGGLAPADRDGSPDIYDARAGGGFHYSPPATPCSTPEACGGGGTEPTVPSNFTTQELHSGGNGPQTLRCAHGRHRVVKHGQARCVSNRHHKHRRKRR